MLNDNIARDLEANIDDIYELIEYELFVSVIRSLVKGKNVEDIASWRITKLAELAVFKKSWAKQLQTMTQSAFPSVKKTIQEALGYSSDLDDVVINKTKGTAQRVIDAMSSEALSQRSKAAVKNALDTINLTNTKAIAQAQNDYLKMVNNAYLKVLNGSTTLDSALRQVANQQATHGSTVEYVTSTGKVMHYNMVDSVRRDILTTVNQTASQISIDKCNEFETDLVEVSAHAGARPNHAVWQGKVYSLTGQTKGYQKLEDVTGYGTPAGLCGVNCRHTFFPYFQGYSKQTDHDELPGLKENNELYQQQQKQRAYERKMRELKRKQAAAKETGDENARKMYGDKLKQTRQEYLNHLKTNNLTRMNEKENPRLDMRG